MHYLSPRSTAVLHQFVTPSHGPLRLPGSLGVAERRASPSRRAFSVIPVTTNATQHSPVGEVVANCIFPRRRNWGKCSKKDYWRVCAAAYGPTGGRGYHGWLRCCRAGEWRATGHDETAIKGGLVATHTSYPCSSPLSLQHRKPCWHLDFLRGAECVANCP